MLKEPGYEELVKANADLTAKNRALQQELDRKAATEKALTFSIGTLHTILNSIDATVFVSDLENNDVLFMNKTMEKCFKGNFQGEKCYTAFRGLDRPCSDCNNTKLLNNKGEPTGLVLWEKKNSNTQKWFLNYDRAIHWVDGRLVKLQISSDITPIKRMEKEKSQIEAQLFQAQKMEALGTLAGGIAHDFNNLLMGIQGRTSLINSDLDSSDPAQEHLGEIEAYVRSAAELTKQLLGFARVDHFDAVPTDMNTVLNQSSQLFGRTRKQIIIQSRFQENVWTVHADQKQIEQVLLNLLINADHAMPGEGELFLETKNVIIEPDHIKPQDIKPGCYVKISVTDNGIGMDEITLQKIFDPFFTTKEKGQGTGLGLASSYSIIKNHHGFIKVYSNLGHGTTFNIYLPASGKKAPASTSQQARIMMGSETILLVDDETMITEVGKAMLKKLGYRVVTATTGKEAVDIIQKLRDQIHLVILDLIMPGMDGSKTFDQIHKMQPDLRVLLASGYAINGQAEEMIKRGCNGFIQKPFNLQELSKKIRQILDK